MNNLIEEDVAENDRKIVASLIHVFYFMLLAGIVALSFQNGNESVLMIAIVTTIIAAIATCLANGLKELYKIVGIVIVLSLVFNFIITKEGLQKNKIETSYNNLIYQNKNYANTENAKNIKKALENYNAENYKVALETLRKYNQNESQDLDRVMNLVNAIKNITPELIPDLKVAMADNFVSLEEYNLLKNQAIKNISSKKLTNEQLVLLGSIK
jgi:hypothetical protein